jgi:hypothetical protein
MVSERKRVTAPSWCEHRPRQPIPRAGRCSLLHYRRKLFRLFLQRRLTLSHSLESRLSCYALVVSLRSLVPPLPVFCLPRVVVHPQSLLSIRSEVAYRNQEENSFSPCIGSCFSRLRVVCFRSTGSILGMHRKSGGILSNSGHPLSFGL